MAGIKLYGNETEDVNSAPAPGQLPGEKFSDYLAKVHSTWSKGRKRTASSFAAVSLNAAHTQDDAISDNFLDWLNRFAVDIDALPPKTKNAIIAKLDLPDTSPVRVQPGHITHHNKDEALTPLTALAMATLAMADPKMQKKGIVLEGTDEEKLLLMHALKEIGFTGKIHNPPAQSGAAFDKAAQAIKDSLPAYLAHVGQKAAPPASPAPPPAAPPPAPPVAAVAPAFTAAKAAPVTNWDDIQAALDKAALEDIQAIPAKAAPAPAKIKADIFNLPISEFIMVAYGEKFTPDQRAVYENARVKAAEAQVEDIVEKKGMTYDYATAFVASGKGVPEGIKPFGAYLMQELPQGYFTQELKDDALRLQTAGRFLGVMQGTLERGKVVPPNIFDKDPQDLKDLQGELKAALEGRPPGAKAQTEALGTFHKLQSKALAAGEHQNAATIGQMTHLFDKTDVQLRAARQAVAAP